jgi:hypothetical protein
MNQSPSLKLAPATPRTHHGMTVFPLVSLEPVELPYVLPDEAIAAGTLTIEEVSESGSVPELLASNSGDTDVLVLDGAQLIGAKQNRMTSRSFILPAGSKTCIPVSCIEQGRWGFRERKFHGSPYHSPSASRKSVRKHEMRLAEGGMALDTGSLGAAQGEVWGSVEAYSMKLGIASRTSALDDVFDGARSRIEDWVEAFPPVEGQVGILIFRGDAALGLDVIGGRGLYRRLHERLLRGYALDALERTGAPQKEAGRASAPDESAALLFLGKVREAKRTEAPTVGKGRYSVLTETVMGAELVDDERLAHQNAFEK